MVESKNTSIFKCIKCKVKNTQILRNNCKCSNCDGHNNETDEGIAFCGYECFGRFAEDISKVQAFIRDTICHFIPNANVQNISFKYEVLDQEVEIGIKISGEKWNLMCEVEPKGQLRSQ